MLTAELAVRAKTMPVSIHPAVERVNLNHLVIIPNPAPGKHADECVHKRK